jgi:hypothetical protein
MREHFLVRPSEDEVFSAFDAALRSVRPECQSALLAFRHSLSATLSTVTLPFAFAFDGFERSRFELFHAAERIRALNIDHAPDNTGLERFRREQAYEKAQIRMAEFTQSAEGVDALIIDTCHFLLQAINHHEIEPAAKELLQQGIVLLWSAFEVLFRDTFEALLNSNPASIQALISHPKTRKLFEAERLPLETLVTHGFDLSSRLGSVLVSQQDFSDLPTVKSSYGVLLPGAASLHDALANRDLWILFQRRHLVVHRRGVVDRTYLDATGETLAIGTTLPIKPVDFENALTPVVAAGAALAAALD